MLLCLVFIGVHFGLSHGNLNSLLHSYSVFDTINRVQNVQSCYAHIVIVHQKGPIAKGACQICHPLKRFISFALSALKQLT